MDLAEALLSRPQWLPQEQLPIAFEQVAFDVQGNLPISLFEYVRVMKPQVSHPHWLLTLMCCGCIPGLHASSFCTFAWPSWYM